MRVQIFKIIIGCVLMLLLPSAVAAQTANPGLEFVRSKAGLTQGEEITLEIKVVDATDANNAEIILLFDPQAVELISLNEAGPTLGINKNLNKDTATIDIAKTTGNFDASEIIAQVKLIQISGHDSELVISADSKIDTKQINITSKSTLQISAALESETVTTNKPKLTFIERLVVQYQDLDSTLQITILTVLGIFILILAYALYKLIKPSPQAVNAGES